MLLTITRRLEILHYNGLGKLCFHLSWHCEQ